MKLDISWTDAPAGRKNYDGNLLVVSTRYKPSRPGWTPLDNGEWIDTGLMKPCAHVALWIQNGAERDGYADEGLAEAYFEGDSFEDVKRQVEEWAQAQADKVYAAVRAAFSK
jgi:hypothetical protein